MDKNQEWSRYEITYERIKDGITEFASVTVGSRSWEELMRSCVTIEGCKHVKARVVNIKRL